jgi:hypothetical protein
MRRRRPTIECVYLLHSSLGLFLVLGQVLDPNIGENAIRFFYTILKSNYR